MASRSKTGRGLTTVPIFLVVPQVKLQKRLDRARRPINNPWPPAFGCHAIGEVKGSI